MRALEPWHIVVLILAFVLLFGYKRLPDAARSIGRSMRIFKAETKGLRKDDGEDEPKAEAVAEKAVEDGQAEAAARAATARAAANRAAEQARAADQERV